MPVEKHSLRIILAYFIFPHFRSVFVHINYMPSRLWAIYRRRYDNNVYDVTASHA